MSHDQEPPTGSSRATGLKVAVVAELFPSPLDHVSGIWALRQAQAVQALGVDLKVIALRRPIPPVRSVRPLVRMPPETSEIGRWARGSLAARRSVEVEGVPASSAWYLSPPRGISYGSWGLWASWPLRRALEKLDREWGIDLVHAHYAAPAGQAASRWCGKRKRPLVISLHGGDLLNTAKRSRYSRKAVTDAIGKSVAVLCNSGWTMELAEQFVEDGDRYRVVHLGTDVPEARGEKFPDPTIVTVANLDPRKRHEDVIRACAALKSRLPSLSYLVIGDGPSRDKLEGLAHELGLDGQVRFTGQLDHGEALQLARRCHLFVMPSVDEAFGVAYIEAMAGGLPAIGCRGEGGPEEIKASGDGIVLVPPRDPETLAGELLGLLDDRRRLDSLSDAALTTVKRSFTWERCGRETLEAYRDALEKGGVAI